MYGTYSKVEVSVRRLVIQLGVGWFAFVPALVGSAADGPTAADTLFDPEHLVDVRIEMKDEDWDRIRFQSRSIFEALQNQAAAESPFTYSKGTVTIDGVRIEDVAIRKKGFLGSLDENRPSLKIRFDKYTDQAPFGRVDRLTLNNNKQDPSRLSQFLSYKLFNESGTVASRCNFAKVTVNGRYLGIYSNVESMKPPLLERGFGDGSGSLFEGTVTDLLAESVQKFERKTDDSDLTDLQAMAAILEAEQLDVNELESLLDIQAFIRFWAMESLIGFWDGYTHNQNNYFLYQNPVNSKYYFLPWGTDSAFTNSVPRPISRIRNKSFHSNSALANRLYRDPATREMYRKTLVEFLSTHWNEDTLLAEVDRVESLLENDVHENNSGFPRAVGKVREFIRGRRRTLEKELERWPIPLRTGPRQPAYTKEIGRGSASFSTEWYAKSPSKPETRGSVEIDLTLHDEQVAFRQIGATAEPSKDWNLARGARKPPTIVLTGFRESDGRRLTLVMGLGRADFRPTKKPVTMFGVLIDGNVFFFLARAVLNPMGLSLIEAQATFDEAGMETGAPVRGELALKVMKFAGGQSPRVSWQEESSDPAARQEP
jgi:spore coat protein CotH